MKTILIAVAVVFVVVVVVDMYCCARLSGDISEQEERLG
jgi:hypothetical protein